MAKRRPWWTVLFLVAAPLAGAALFAVLALRAPPVVPSASGLRAAPRVAVPGTDDVLWDPESARVAEARPAVPVAPGDEFRVRSEVEDPPVAAAVLAASRKAIPLTLELLGGEPRAQRAPYEVLVVSDRERVKEEARRVRWTPPPQIVGFADLVEGRAFLTSDDLGDPDDVLALAGPGSFLTVVAAHEAAHLVAERCLPAAGGNATWLCEGIAQHVGEQAALATWPGTETGAIPYFSHLMRVCQGLADADRLPTTSDILTGHVDWIDEGSRYAIWWAFLRYLNEPPQRERTRRLVARARELPWRPDGAQRIVDLVDEIWGPDGRRELTAGFRAYVKAFAPRWGDVSGRLEVSGTTWTQVGRPKECSDAERARVADGDAYRIRGEFEILPRGDGIARVEVGGTPAATTIVCFEAGHGVGLYRSDGTRTRDLGPPVAFDWDARVQIGRRTAFAIDVAGGTVRVSIGGSQPLAWDGGTGGRGWVGRWAVGCCNYAGSRTPTNSAVVWRGVRLE